MLRKRQWLPVLMGLLIVGYAVPALAWFDPGTGPGEPVHAVAMTTNGKIVAGGPFMQFDGKPRTGVARLAHHGALEAAVADTNGTVSAAAALPEGKSLVGGSFTTIGGLARMGLARLDDDGTVDPAFDARVEGAVFAIALQSDGKIVIGGHFSRVGGTPRSNIARLHPNGTLDTSFQPGGGVDGFVLAVALQRDGKVLVGGFFNWVDGKPFLHLARLQANGSVDLAFHPDPDNIVTGVGELYDGKILAGGYFTNIGGQPRRHLARLRADGAADSAFSSDTNAPVLAVRRNDHHFFVGGEFTVMNGAPVSYVARLDPAGGLDPAYKPSLDGPVRALWPSNDGKLLVGGSFLNAGGQPSPRLARLRSDGSAEPRTADFDPGADEPIHQIAREAAGTFLVSGYFSTIDGARRPYLARLDASGSLDAAFDPRPDYVVHAVAPQPDGRILVGGTFNGIGGLPWPYLARLHADGTVDESFAPPMRGPVFAIAVQADGKILAASETWVVRFRPDGSFDGYLANVDGAVSALAIQPDGKILIGGAFKNVSFTPRPGFARLTANGDLDWSFDARLDPYASVSGIAVQPDGRIVIGGSFATVAGVPRKHLARLHANGSLDPAFNAGSAVNAEVSVLALDPEGRILAGGFFVAPRVALARFRQDGTVDTAFDAGVPQMSGAARVHAISLLDDGTLVAGGWFEGMSGAPRANIARIGADGTPAR
ncbi:MAG TPA: delta-60 repeat domain-containing protein [Thermoanaerobaculia bacterium]